MESDIRSELFKDNEEIRAAKDELEDKIASGVNEVSAKYGRTTTTHALGKVHSDFATRRFLNPYPIPDEDYEFLVEFTSGQRVTVKGRSAEEVAEEFVEQYREMDEEAQQDVETVIQEHDDRAIYAWVDLLLSDLFVEERDYYANIISAELMEEICNEKATV